MAVSFAGMGGGQLLLNLAAPTRADLFILVSILISFAVVPILLSAKPAPEAAAPTPVALTRLYRVSPLGTVGTFAAGLTNGTVFGMGAVYARQTGLSIAEVSLFMGALIAGAALLQWPIGKASDVIDRRKVITATTFAAAGIAVLARQAQLWPDVWLLAIAGVFGGLALTIHSLCLAYTNDYLDPGEMVAASSGLVLVLGIGSILGPMTVGWLMDLVGAGGFFWWLAAVHAGIGLFAVWRMTRREPRPIEAQGPYVAIPARLSPVATAAAEQAVAAAQAEAQADAEDEAAPDPRRDTD
jgi:MFS family permease